MTLTSFVTLLKLVSVTLFQVTVALVDLSPDFHYNSVPRLSPHSFLKAKSKNTSPYTMLAGPANVFMDNNFIAKVNNIQLCKSI